MHQDDDTSVADLVAGAVAGDPEAWNALVDRYTPLLVAVISRVGLRGAPLEDVAQTVWLRLIEHLADLREPRALPMWIVTTARREAQRLAMSETRSRSEDPQGAVLAALPDEGVPDPDAELVRAERQEALLAGLATLSPKQRELLLLLIEDPPVPYAEISRRTGVAVGGIGPTRSRALQRLRDAPSLIALMDEEERRHG